VPLQKATKQTPQGSTVSKQVCWPSWNQAFVLELISNMSTDTEYQRQSKTTAGGFSYEKCHRRRRRGRQKE
jgi:hypothetical protein